MPYIVHNITNKRLSFALRPALEVVGVPAWRVRRDARKNTLWVNINPHQKVDLCGPPWNLTETEARHQNEVVEMLRKCYLKEIRGEEYAPEAKPMFEVLKEPDYALPVISYGSDGHPIGSTVTQSSSDHSSIVKKPKVKTEEEARSDRFVLPDDLRTKLKKHDPKPGTDCSNGIHDYTHGPCAGCGVSEGLVCKGCQFVGKNMRSIQMHQKTCKPFLEQKP
jgi:hypothetical protein